MNIVPTIHPHPGRGRCDTKVVTLPYLRNIHNVTVQTIKNPIIDLQELSTTVRVREGNTVVLAGLISQVKDTEHEGLTGLGDLPLVGGWFKHVDDTVQTRELVIFITPHIRDRG
jgi:type II secretory pathway component GspD/PulD (secretin)